MAAAAAPARRPPSTVRRSHRHRPEFARQVLPVPQTHYTQVPNEVLRAIRQRSSGLTLAFLLYLVERTYGGFFEDGSQGRPAVVSGNREELAQEMGCTKEAIDKLLAQLEEKAVIERRVITKLLWIAFKPENLKLLPLREPNLRDEPEDTEEVEQGDDRPIGIELVDRACPPVEVPAGKKSKPQPLDCYVTKVCYHNRSSAKVKASIEVRDGVLSCTTHDVVVSTTSESKLYRGTTYRSSSVRPSETDGIPDGNGHSNGKSHSVAKPTPQVQEGKALGEAVIKMFEVGGIKQTRDQERQFWALWWKQPLEMHRRIGQDVMNKFDIGFWHDPVKTPTPYSYMTRSGWEHVISKRQIPAPQQKTRFDVAYDKVMQMVHSDGF